jgi:hypothetical protein
MRRLCRSTALLTSVAAIGASVLLAADLRGEWQRTDTSLAWRDGAGTVWRFVFDPKNGKPFFDPLGPVGGPSLTNFKPEDHPWHYGLWFSWKYINKANYWEEDRQSGKAEGVTSWRTPAIQTQPDGRATIAMALTYTHPSGRVDLTETRDIEISAPDAQGAYTIDWRSRFVAGAEGAELGRTPMPGEPGGQVNGGYAGLGARLASAPLVMSVVTVDGAVDEFVRDRARPNSPAVGATFSDAGRIVGAIAVLSDPNNVGERAPWYLINSADMRFVDPAILAPAVRTLKPGEEWVLRYRVAISRTAWTAERLKAAVQNWR